jgi:DNA-binding response OmpR family regulator
MTGHSPKPLTVLVAEDEPAMLTLVARYMRRLGFNVIEASEGDTAWELAQEHTPDLVILDVMMPGMSGWEVCKRLKGQGPSGQFGDTGVIMLTGIGENLNEMTSSLFAADAWLNKPFQFPELDERVRQTLARYEKIERMSDPETLNGEVEDSPRLFTIPDAGAVEEDFAEEEGELDRQITARVLSRQPEEEPVMVESGLARVSRSQKAAAPARAKAKSAPKAKTKAKAKSAPKAKKATPKKATPKKATPKKATPKKATPKKATPKKATPKKRAAPAKRRSATQAKQPSAKRVVKKGAAKKGAAKKGAAKKGAAKKGAAKKRTKGSARRGV